MKDKLNEILRKEGLKLYLVETKKDKCFMIGYEKKAKMFNMIPYTQVEHIARIEVCLKNSKDKIPFRVHAVDIANQEYQERLNSLTKRTLEEYYGDAGRSRKREN